MAMRTGGRRLLGASAAGLALLLGIGCSVFAHAAPASPRAHAAIATNPEGTCPYWSELNTSGTLTGKSPQVVNITKRVVGSNAEGTEWEVRGHATQRGISLYSGVVEIMAPSRFGLGLVRFVWMHGRGNELVARVTLTAEQVFRSRVCGHHPRVLPPGPYTGRGSSCADPVLSEFTAGWVHGGIPRGIQRHMPIEVSRGGDTGEYWIGHPPTPREAELAGGIHTNTVNATSDESIIICRAKLRIIETHGEPYFHSRVYNLKLEGPHEVKPFSVGQNASGGFYVYVYGRYAKGRP